MIYYYCTCTTNRLHKRRVQKNILKFREVLADDEGVCKDCGHYAVASPKKMTVFNGELYRTVTDTHKSSATKRSYVETHLYKGSKLYYEKKRGKNKNGDMDI